MAPRKASSSMGLIRQWLPHGIRDAWTSWDVAGGYNQPQAPGEQLLPEKVQLRKLHARDLLAALELVKPSTSRADAYQQEREGLRGLGVGVGDGGGGGGEAGGQLLKALAAALAISGAAGGLRERPGLRDGEGRGAAGAGAGVSGGEAGVGGASGAGSSGAAFGVSDEELKRLGEIFASYILQAGALS